MTEQTEFGSQMRDRLELVLRAFAKLVATRVPSITWRVELPSSRVYDLVAVLTFMHRDYPQTELVTVSLETRDLVGGTWSMDATDRESLPLELAGEPMAYSIGADMESMDRVADDIDARLQAWSERIVSELQP